MKIGLDDHPLIDGATHAALDLGTTSPLQGLYGGQLGFGKWKHYLLSDLEWSATTAGTQVTMPKNAGKLSVVRLSDDYARVFIDSVIGGIAVLNANTPALMVRYPAGLDYGCKAPVDAILNSRGTVTPLMIGDSVAGFAFGYISTVNNFFSLNWTGVGAGGATQFQLGRTYTFYGSFDLELAQTGSRA